MQCPPPNDGARTRAERDSQVKRDPGDADDGRGVYPTRRGSLVDPPHREAPKTMAGAAILGSVRRSDSMAVRG